MRNRSSLLIVAGRLVTSYGYYLVIPFLAVYATKHLGFSLAQAGVLLAVLNIGRRGMGILAGYWSDLFGARRIMLIGLALEITAYLSFATVRNFWMLCLVTFLGGTGGCLYNVSSRSILAATQTKEQLARDFSLFYICMNIGALLGPATYAWFVTTGQVHVSFLMSAALYTIFACMVLLWLPSPAAAGAQGKAIKPSHVLSVVKHREFMLYCLLITGSWFVVNQLYVGLPLHVSQSGYSDQFIALLNGLNAAIVVVLQYSSGRLVARSNTNAQLNILALGTVLMSAGFFLLVLPGQLAIYGALVVVTLGEILFLGVVEFLAASFAPPESSGLYLGFATFSWAVGASISSLLGGWAMGLSVSTGGTKLFWGGLLVVGILVAVLMQGLRRTMRQSLDRNTAPETALG